jgi:hypothetical protein
VIVVCMSSLSRRRCHLRAAASVQAVRVGAGPMGGPVPPRARVSAPAAAAVRAGGGEQGEGAARRDGPRLQRRHRCRCRRRRRRRRRCVGGVCARCAARCLLWVLLCMVRCVAVLQCGVQLCVAACSCVCEGGQGRGTGLSVRVRLGVCARARVPACQLSVLCVFGFLLLCGVPCCRRPGVIRPRHAA